MTLFVPAARIYQYSILVSTVWAACWMQTDEILGHAGRAAIIELILATDMKQHFSLISRLQVYMLTSSVALSTSSAAL